MKNVKCKMKNVKWRMDYNIWSSGALVLLCSCVLVLLCSIAHPYQRIISLGPSITKAIYLLKAEDKLIANTIYCTNPPSANEKEKIGTVIEVNIEKIFNLKPDLVLATSLLNPKVKERLRKLGLRVVVLPTPKDFNDICRQFLKLGKMVGKEREAKEIIKDARDKVASIKKKTKNLYSPKVLVQVGAEPLFVATGEYFINDFIEFAGGINVAKDVKEGIYSREEALNANPDVIIITTMGIITEEEKETWKKYKALSAAKNNRIYIIDADKIASPTPLSFVEALEEFFKIFHSK